MTLLTWWFFMGVAGTTLMSVFFRGLHVQQSLMECDR